MTRVFCSPGPAGRQLAASPIWRDPGDPAFCGVTANDVFMREAGEKGEMKRGRERERRGREVEGGRRKGEGGQLSSERVLFMKGLE